MPTLRPSLVNNVVITLGGNLAGYVINAAEIGHDLVNGMFCIRGTIAGNEEAVFVYLNDAAMTRGDGAFLVFSGDIELGERRVYSIPLVDILLKLLNELKGTAALSMFLKQVYNLKPFS